MIRTTIWQKETSRRVRVPQDWRLLFAVWIALVLPLLAFSVVYSKKPTGLTSVDAQRAQDNAALAMLEQVPAPDAIWAVLDAEEIDLTSVSSTGLNSKWDAVAIAPNNPEIIVIAAQRDLAITRDRGRTWVRLMNVLPRPALTLVVSQTNDHTFYAKLDGLGVFGSNDGGLHWQPLVSP
ncbi:MAG: hypothetical protein HY741_25510 [Chloroflexi bacterium]|nr:hypothetical protein [Chloroflexota bacterium]